MKLTRLLDLPPSPGNPRNSEGSFIRLTDGRTLFMYSHFTRGMQDDADAALWSLTLDAQGGFSRPREVIPSGENGARNLMSLSLLRMRDGSIGLFYLRRIGQTLLEMVLRRSPDEGETWLKPTPVTPRPGFFVVNNDRVTRLENGDILIPAAEHKKALRPDGSVFFDARAEAVFFRSRDDGATFEELPGKGAAPYPSVCASGLQEPGVMELDGRLWAWARTDLGRQWEMFSMDSGVTWTPPAPSRFTSPLSPMSVLRLKNGRLLAVYNPIPLYNGRSPTEGGVWTGGRTPLSARISRDEGATWSAPVALETESNHGYCYTAMMEEAPGQVLLAYCAGGPGDGSCLARLRIARLTIDDKEEIP